MAPDQLSSLIYCYFIGISRQCNDNITDDTSHNKTIGSYGSESRSNIDDDGYLFKCWRCTDTR